ncbi:MAG: ABC transporter ATP-binding protein [Candidatus Omnitrophica bacterium]|nr:ABC transporter ATP-binding protein [Candidatus Omnitrophota bacterium]
MNTIEIENLCVDYRTGDRTLRALDRVDLSVAQGEILALVGESGCGKSTLGLALGRLLPSNASIPSGVIRIGGRDVLRLSSAEVPQVRGNEIGYVFQHPGSALNPLMTIGEQIVEALRLGGLKDPAELQIAAKAQLGRFGIMPAEERIHQYPHQMSGGMKQRVMIAMATCRRPLLLVADEPTSALDVTVQASVLKIVGELTEGGELSVVFITHDLRIAFALANRVAVMYAGRIVELGDVDEVKESPKHPYTERLLECVPGMARGAGRLSPIEGEPPQLWDIPAGCAFHPRCHRVEPRCRQLSPGPVSMSPTHWSRCLLLEEKL